MGRKFQSDMVMVNCHLTSLVNFHPPRVQLGNLTTVSKVPHTLGPKTEFISTQWDQKQFISTHWDQKLCVCLHTLEPKIVSLSLHIATKNCEFVPTHWDQKLSLSPHIGTEKNVFIPAHLGPKIVSSSPHIETKNCVLISLNKNVNNKHS